MSASSPGIEIRLRLPRAGYELDVDLQLAGRGVSVLFGPSGSGKTSVLRCVAGLERAPAGRVRIGDSLWQDEAQDFFLPPWQRPLGYVFQEASLFEHLDVRRNLEYGLRRSRVAGGAAALDEAIELLGIGALLQRRPGQLSGGESQRVAIARAIAMQPRLLLLDEPLASLDLARRREILPWLERLHEELVIPMLYVTHSLEELSRLADEVVLLDHGRVQAAGAMSSLIASGQLTALAGEEAATVLEGRVQAREEAWYLLRIQLGEHSVLVRDEGFAVGSRVRLRILARDVSLSLAPSRHSSIQNQLPVVVQTLADDSHPSQVLLRLQYGNQPLLARLTRKAVAELGIVSGMELWAQVKAVAVLA